MVSSLAFRYPLSCEWLKPRHPGTLVPTTGDLDDTAEGSLAAWCSAQKVSLVLMNPLYCSLSPVPLPTRLENLLGHQPGSDGKNSTNQRDIQEQISTFSPFPPPLLEDRPSLPDSKYLVRVHWAA